MTDLDLDEIVQGKIPLPRKGNELVIHLAKQFKVQYKQDDWHNYQLYAAGQEGEKIFILGVDSFLYDYQKIIVQEYDIEGKLLASDCFRKKEIPNVKGNAFGAAAVIGSILTFLSLMGLATSKCLPNQNELLQGIGVCLGLTITPSLVYSLCSYANSSRKSVKTRAKKTQIFSDLSRRLLQKNQAETKNLIDKIGIYQGSIDEVSRELERPLERIETGVPDKYNLPLRIRAYLLGADAIVHYQPGSGIGTPVRFTDEK